jgi:hypothetical protein
VRYLILSDMHGNEAALRAVLRKVRRKRFDAILVLGDLVGYGAAPNQVVELIRSLPGTVHAVRGNHDKVAVGIDSGETFNQVALIAARWTADTRSRGLAAPPTNAIGTPSQPGTARSSRANAAAASPAHATNAASGGVARAAARACAALTAVTTSSSCSRPRASTKESSSDS